MDAERAAAALALALEERASVRPLLLVVEDVQWMDSASREVLEALLPLDLPPL